MRAVLQIENDRRTGGVGFQYQGEKADLFEIFRDLSENAQDGDNITIQFQIDPVNMRRVNNFIAIMSLYDYHF